MNPRAGAVGSFRLNNNGEVFFSQGKLADAPCAEVPQLGEEIPEDGRVTGKRWDDLLESLSITAFADSIRNCQDHLY
ncbi:hypothetical protein Q9233_003405 [Columba guinea]|nr:hypothetical protein Q9233_003405 [Columba guinea]